MYDAVKGMLVSTTIFVVTKINRIFKGKSPQTPRDRNNAVVEQLIKRFTADADANPILSR